MEAGLSEMMTAAHVLDALERLEAAGVEAWVDGGWGVDALLGDRRANTRTSIS